MPGRPTGADVHDDKDAVGLDFGTSTTVVASGDDVVWIGSAHPWLPSLVGYDDSGAVVVGEAAQIRMIGGEGGDTFALILAVRCLWNPRWGQSKPALPLRGKSGEAAG